MKTADLIEARRAAEAAVADMADGPLKVAAFETILSRLLDGADARGRMGPASSRVSEARPSGTTDRIIGLLEDGFFAQPRSLRDVQEALSERGWHYSQEGLGTPLTRLVRKRSLRRIKVVETGKKLWKYSLY